MKQHCFISAAQKYIVIDWCYLCLLLCSCSHTWEAANAWRPAHPLTLSSPPASPGAPEAVSLSAGLHASHSRQHPSCYQLRQRDDSDQFILFFNVGSFAASICTRNGVLPTVKSLGGDRAANIMWRVFVKDFVRSQRSQSVTCAANIQKCAFLFELKPH